MYVNVVVPPDTAETTPDVPIVATLVVPLDHVPPPPSLTEAVVPGHVAKVPVIALTAEVTVTVVKALQPVASV